MTSFPPFSILIPHAYLGKLPFIYEFKLRNYVKKFLKSYRICSDDVVSLVITKICSNDDMVYIKPSHNKVNFNYVYEYYLEELNFYYRVKC